MVVVSFLIEMSLEVLGLGVEDPSRITDHHPSLVLRNLCQFLSGFPFSRLTMVGNPAKSETIAAWML